MEQSIQFMMGVSLCVLGLSFFLRASDWMQWFKDVQNAGKEVSMPLGAFSLLLGSLIVGFHQIWEGWPLVISAVGLLIMVKGTIYLLIPGWLPKKLKVLTDTAMRPYLMFYGLILLWLGMGVLDYWHTATVQMEPTFFDMVFGGPAQ